MIDVPDPIRRIWQEGASDLFLLSQVSHAFNVLPLALETNGAAPKFWFPDYFCNGPLSKLRDSGAEIAFYPVDLNLRPDWAACRAMAESGPPDVFALVHYMGSRSDIETARAFCDEIGAKLLEDATQLLRPVDEIGSLGDFVCFSPRKFFDIPDGGLLIVRHAEDARRLADMLGRVTRRTPPTLRWRVRRTKNALRNRLGLERKRVTPLRQIRLEDVSPEPQPFGEPFMSRIACKELAHAIDSGMLDEIVQKRLRYQDEVREFVGQWDDVSLLDKPSNSVACWVGLTCHDPAHAQLVLDTLRRHGFPALPWPNQLPPEIHNREVHSQAIKLLSTTLIVPHANKR
ncbi:MAG: DegT/DnrJ/EryC1/StrS family aminotransferase [Oricola sp.]|nr:DegT/DnrJ/EryC1/StrS family aminotransferase [Oricola sp.]